ncbi:MAG: PHP domain-containing protein [Deltaproteobacteria bacterium]|nr:PHP domain-containing protein [Deltaproteobacteria bacterium]
MSTDHDPKETVKTDLHGHTAFSDGRTSPEAYVALRASLGFEVIALSDHDTFAGVPRAAREASRLGITIVPAMEASSFVHFGTSDAEQIHVLAYYPRSFLEPGRLEKTQMYARSLILHERWRAFVLDWLDRRSAEERDAIDPEHVLHALEPFAFPGLQSFIDMLVLNRQKRAFRDFHAHHVLFWTQGQELFGWSPEALIDTIRTDGAFDVVAHPNRVRDKERMLRVLEYASGIEVYTSRHKPKTSAYFLELARSLGKHWTASTDDHQHDAYEPPQSGSPLETVQRILADQ